MTCVKWWAGEEIRRMVSLPLKWYPHPSDLPIKLVPKWAFGTKLFLGLVGSQKENFRFSYNAFFGLYMNELWILKVLRKKLGVSKINPRLLCTKALQCRQEFAEVNFANKLELGVVTLLPHPGAHLVLHDHLSIKVRTSSSAIFWREGGLLGVFISKFSSENK